MHQMKMRVRQPRPMTTNSYCELCGGLGNMNAIACTGSDLAFDPSVIPMTFVNGCDESLLIDPKNGTSPTVHPVTVGRFFCDIIVYK